jgi:hypothetical protein
MIFYGFKRSRFLPGTLTSARQGVPGTLKLLINPNEGRPFPIETPELKLSSEDMKKLADGTIDVAIYGRIFYTDLSNSATGMTNEYLKSLFCFYVLRDGSTMSACPNHKDAYTNWAP